MIATVAWRLLVVAVVESAAAAAGNFRLTVLHTNDMHSSYDETRRPASAGGNFGGFARLRAALDAERARAAADGAPAVFLNAGDTFHGTHFYDVFGWQQAADFVGDLGVDAMCLGNHEFHEGPKILASFLKSQNISSIPTVVTNMNTEREPCLNSVRASTVLTVGNRTIGIVGYLTPNTKWLNKIGNVEILDELESVKHEVLKLKQSGVDFIIALGHSGINEDQRLAKEVDGIDLIVGGHSHSYLFSGPSQDTEIPVTPYPLIVNRGEKIVPIVQVYKDAKYLGKLVLTFDEENRLIDAVGAPIFLDQTIPQDKKTLDKVEHYKQLLDKIRSNRIAIGKTKVFLDGNCSCMETNLADFICDSFIHFNLNNLLKNNVTLTGWTDAAVAIIISSSIKGSINALEVQGAIYEDDMISVLPYKTTLFKVTLTGMTLLKALEHSAYTYDFNNCANPENNIFGAFIQVSGLRVTYNMKNAVGTRVKSVMIRCSHCKVPSYEQLDLDEQYTVIMPKYLVNGGDQFQMIKDGIINVVELNGTEVDALQMYVKEMSPIEVSLENRIQILNPK